MTDEPQPGPGAPASWGPLTIREHLASGASSEVYRARDTILGRHVALKLFNTQDEVEQQKLLEQGRALARIRHPNIVQLLGAARHDGRVGFWMEIVEGSNLEDLLAEQGPMRVPEVIRTGRQLCAALATAHNAGLFFRDIKLQNVVREKDSGIRLMGFGPDTEEAELAPELLEGGPASRQSDIYALGSLLRRMAADAPGEDVITAQFRECIGIATAPDPDKRFATAEEFARALTRAGKHPPSRTRRLLGIGLILVLAVIVIMQWPSQYLFVNTLYRVNEDHTRTEFVDGSAVGSGDRLALEVTTTVPMYVFVFAEDVDGNAWGLFPSPMPNVGHGNPLRADETHTLPAEGDNAPVWELGDTPHLARLHVLALPERVPEFQALYERVPVLGVAERSTSACAPLIQAARQLDEDAEFAIGVTYRVIEFGSQER